MLTNPEKKESMEWESHQYKLQGVALAGLQYTGQLKRKKVWSAQKKSQTHSDSLAWMSYPKKQVSNNNAQYINKEKKKKKK